MKNKNVSFLKSAVTRLYKAGRLGKDDANLLQREFDIIEHSLSTKDFRRLNKSIELISKMLVKVL